MKFAVFERLFKRQTIKPTRIMQGQESGFVGYILLSNYV